MRTLLLILAFLVAPNLATSQVITLENPMPSPEQEAQAQQFFSTLRCMVCEGQSLEGSNADLAVDMRMLIRDMLKQGKSEQEIRRYLISRYGQSISIDVNNNKMLILLVLIPFILLGIGVIYGYRKIQSKNLS